MSRKACLFVAVVMGLSACATAGPLQEARKEAEEAQVEPVFVRMYNVQDLMLGRDHPYDGGMLPATHLSEGVQAAAQAASGGGFGDLFGVAPDLGGKAALTSALSPDILEEIIKRTVGVGTWDDEGGRGRIERVGALLVITQTQENHKQIKDLIDQFRRARRMASIHARWLLTGPKELTHFLPAGANKPVVPHVVDLAPLGKPDVDARIIYEGRVTCFDRQTTHLASGSAEVYCTDQEPVVAEDAVGWDPTMTPLLFGAFLQVTPSLSEERNEATVDIRSSITEKGGEPTSTTVEAATAEGSAKAEIDKPKYLGHTFRTTLRMPLDTPVLVGGMTSPEALEGKVIYLILEVSASEGLPEAEAQAPEGKKKAK